MEEHEGNTTFIDLVNEHYTCCICLNILQDPVQHVECGNMYCKNCSINLYECPICRTLIHQFYPAPKPVINFLHDLERYDGSQQNKCNNNSTLQNYIIQLRKERESIEFELRNENMLLIERMERERMERERIELELRSENMLLIERMESRGSESMERESMEMDIKERMRDYNTKNAIHQQANIHSPISNNSNPSSLQQSNSFISNNSNSNFLSNNSNPTSPQQTNIRNSLLSSNSNPTFPQQTSIKKRTISLGYSNPPNKSSWKNYLSDYANFVIKQGIFDSSSITSLLEVADMQPKIETIEFVDCFLDEDTRAILSEYPRGYRIMLHFNE